MPPSCRCRLRRCVCCGAARPGGGSFWQPPDPGAGLGLGLLDFRRLGLRLLGHRGRPALRLFAASAAGGRDFSIRLCFSACSAGFFSALRSSSPLCPRPPLRRRLREARPSSFSPLSAALTASGGVKWKSDTTAGKSSCFSSATRRAGRSWGTWIPSRLPLPLRSTHTSQLW